MRRLLVLDVEGTIITDNNQIDPNLNTFLDDFRGNNFIIVLNTELDFTHMEEIDLETKAAINHSSFLQHVDRYSPRTNRPNMSKYEKLKAYMEFYNVKPQDTFCIDDNSLCNMISQRLGCNAYQVTKETPVVAILQHIIDEQKLTLASSNLSVATSPSSSGFFKTMRRRVKRKINPAERKGKQREITQSHAP